MKFGLLYELEMLQPWYDGMEEVWFGALRGMRASIVHA